MTILLQGTFFSITQSDIFNAADVLLSRNTSVDSIVARDFFNTTICLLTTTLLQETLSMISHDTVGHNNIITRDFFNDVEQKVS